MSKNTQKKLNNGTAATPFTERFIAFCSEYFNITSDDTDTSFGMLLVPKGGWIESLPESMYSIVYKTNGEKYILGHSSGEKTHLSRGLNTARKILFKCIKKQRVAFSNITHATHCLHTCMSQLIDTPEHGLTEETISIVETNINIATYCMLYAGFKNKMITQIRDRYIEPRYLSAVVKDLLSILDTGDTPEAEEEQEYIKPKKSCLTKVDREKVVLLLEQAATIDRKMVRYEFTIQKGGDAEYERRYKKSRSKLRAAAIICLSCGIDLKIFHEAAKQYVSSHGLSASIEAIRLLLPEANSQIEPRWRFEDNK